MTGAALLCGLAYVACLIVQRFADRRDACAELRWRAQGARRAFRLIDWTPLP